MNHFLFFFLKFFLTLFFFFFFFLFFFSLPLVKGRERERERGREKGRERERRNTIVTWLILPVVICLSQRLSHACVSINDFILWNCEWLIKSVIVYLIVPYYLDNRGNSRANTCEKSRLLEGMYLLDNKTNREQSRFLVIHNNFIESHGSTPAMYHSNFCPINFRW